MFEKLGDRWEDKFEDLPGFSLAVAIVVLILAWWSPEAGEGGQHEINALVAVGVAYLLYRSGSIWDYLFDLAYGNLKDGPRWPGGKKLHDARKDAAEKLNCPRTGLYARANGILKGTKKWKNEVKAKMDASKAARSFIIPLFVLFLVELLKRFDGKGIEWVANRVFLLSQHLPQRSLQSILVISVLVYLLTDKEKLQWICFASAAILLGNLLLRLEGAEPSLWHGISPNWRWILVGAALVLATYLYVWQRLRAMVRLYELSGELPLSKQLVYVVDAEEKNKPERRELLFAGKAVVPLRMVALYPCIEQGVSEDHLNRAESLVSSWALMHVQVCMLPDRPSDVTPAEKEDILPVSLLYDKDYMKIVDKRSRKEHNFGRNAKPDVLIRVVMNTKGKPMEAAAKELEDSTDEPQRKQIEAKDKLKKLQKEWEKDEKTQKNKERLKKLINR